MIADVELMARNAELFNGKDSAVYATAKKLLNRLQASLLHERLHLGPAKDTIRLMEEAIQKKKVFLKKTFNLSSVPDK